MPSGGGIRPPVKTPEQQLDELAKGAETAVYRLKGKPHEARLTKAAKAVLKQPAEVACVELSYSLRRGTLFVWQTADTPAAREALDARAKGLRGPKRLFEMDGVLLLAHASRLEQAEVDALAFELVTSD